MSVIQATGRPVGSLLKRWRSQRRLSQLDLSGRAGVSTRHLSFVETGRSQPSRELVLHLAEHLDVPLRERNTLLVAAGYAPMYGETPVDAPPLEGVRTAIDEVLRAHEPWPAIVVDRGWNLVTANQGAGIFLEGVAPELFGPPLNVLRTCFHPDGLAPRITNLGAVTAHVVAGLRRRVDTTGDPQIAALLAEIAGYPGVNLGPDPWEPGGTPQIAVTMRLMREGVELSFVSMIATFGSALDVTLEELTLETFLPADATTSAALHAWAAS